MKKELGRDRKTNSQMKEKDTTEGSKQDEKEKKKKKKKTKIEIEGLRTTTVEKKYRKRMLA